eukprot:11172578-Lingulodinium_polyedra.AAC.1
MDLGHWLLDEGALARHLCLAPLDWPVVLRVRATSSFARAVVALCTALSCVRGGRRWPTARGRQGLGG